MRGSLRARATGLMALLVLIVGVSPGVANAAASVTVGGFSVPGAPGALAVDSVGHRGYVALTDRPVVVVFNTRTSKILGEVEVGRVTALAVDRSRRRVYAAQDDATLAEIDTRSRSVVRRTAIGVLAFRMRVDAATHKVYVLSDQAALTVVDPTRSDQTTTVPLPTSPTGIAIDSTRHRAYVAQGSGITVLDTVDDEVLGTADPGVTPFGLAVDPRTQRLFAVSREDQVVRVLDTATGALVGTFADPDPPIVGDVEIDSGAGLLYITHSGFPSSTLLTVFDTATYSVRAQVDVGRNSDVEVDTVTHKAFLPSFRTFSVIVVTPAT